MRQEVKTGLPRGYNTEVHTGNPKTKERHQARKYSRSRPTQQWQQVLKVKSAAQTQPQQHPAYQLSPDGLQFSKAEGPHRQVRCLLADLVACEDQSNFLSNLTYHKRRRMIEWLTKHSSTPDVTTKNLLQGLIVTINNAQKSSSHASQNIFQTYDATAKEEQDKRQARKDKAATYFWVKVPWLRSEMQILGLHAILNDSEVQNLYPVSSERDKVKTSYSLSVPNGLLIQNYGKVSEDPSLDQDTPPIIPTAESCVCQKYKTDSSIDYHGHVATVDPGFIKDRRLRSYWLKGRKYRCQAHPQVLMTNFEKSLDNF